MTHNQPLLVYVGAVSNYRDDVLRRIKDEDASIPDKDAFLTECVIPLRKLRDEGILDKIEEIPFAMDGDFSIGIVEIIGAINYDA
jgi:hypothetical protein